MGYTIRFAHGPLLSVADVTGLAFADQAEDALAEIERETKAHGAQYLLINLLDVVGTMEPEDHRQLGMLAARHLSHLKKVASLVPAEKVTHVSERAAQAEGMQLRVFVMLTEAMAWLTGGLE
jgi:hypothetical protein